MLSKEEILRSLSHLAKNYMQIAIIWHLVLYIFLAVVLLARTKVSNRMTGCLLSLLMLSVSLFAWLAKNPFNGLVFLLAGLAMFFFSYTVQSQKINLNPSVKLRAVGIVILLFGLLYPHFLGPPGFVYFYAAPAGIIPCPTLLVITGFSLMFELRQFRKWMIILLDAAIFYSLFGVFVLRVYIDVVLVLASVLLLLQLLADKKLEKNSRVQALN